MDVPDGRAVGYSRLQIRAIAETPFTKPYIKRLPRARRVRRNQGAYFDEQSPTLAGAATLRVLEKGDGGD